MEEVESRYFYLSCPECNNYTLDLGFNKSIECGHCNKIYDAEVVANEMAEDKSIKKEERKFLMKLDSEIKELTNLALSVDR